jgi:hypothetical protein
LSHFVRGNLRDPGAKLSFGPEACQMTPSFEKYLLNEVIFILRFPRHRSDPRSHCGLVTIDQDVKARGFACQS